jgi:hypothetical protein
VSCYFCVLCRDCKRYVPASATHNGAASGLAGDEYLRPFLVAHVGHDLTVVSEYEDEAFAGCVNASRHPNSHESARLGTREVDDVNGKINVVGRLHTRV